MKNTQDRKFERQVNHLQSFIGMPHWNGRNPTLSEIREYDRLILEQQAIGFKPKRKSVLQRVSSWMVAGVSKAAGQIVKAGEKTSKITSEIKKPVATGTEYCS